MDSVLSEMFEILWVCWHSPSTRDRMAFYGMQYKRQDNEAVFIQTNKVGTNKHITIDRSVPCLNLPFPEPSLFIYGLTWISSGLIRLGLRSKKWDIYDIIMLLINIIKIENRP